MTIYYYDGYLTDADTSDIITPFIEIDAAGGYRENHEVACRLREERPDCTVLTNQVMLLDSFFCWDNKRNGPDVYLWRKQRQCWEHLSKIYPNVRISNSLMKMYIGNMFEED